MEVPFPTAGGSEPGITHESKLWVPRLQVAFIPKYFHWNPMKSHENSPLNPLQSH